MKFNLRQDITFETIEAKITPHLRDYKIKKMKNPLFGYEYIQVEKNAFIGVWIRIMDNKNEVHLIGCIPSTLARAFLGGLLLILATLGGQNKVKKEIETIFTRELQMSRK